MAERVVQLLSDEGRHARFAAAGRRRAVQFGCDQVVPRFEALYERVLRQPPAPPVMGPDAGAYAGAHGMNGPRRRASGERSPDPNRRGTRGAAAGSAARGSAGELVLASRGSDLALAQTRLVGEALVSPPIPASAGRS